MPNTQKVIGIYDKNAITYDKQNAIMERMFSKARNIFRSLNGEILEVGIGTGNNLSYYSPDAHITGFEISHSMIRQTYMKIKLMNLKNIKNIIEGDVQNLNKYFKQSSFDYITSTCVFCSVPNPIKGLREVSKVLRPSGKLIQIEHGLSNFRLINFFLRIFDPISSNIRGFHLTRNHIKNLQNAGFKILRSWNLDPTGIVKIIISQPSNNE